MTATPELTADELARVAAFDAAPALAETSPLTVAMLALAQELEGDSKGAQQRADTMERTEENVRHHKAETRHARVAAHTAARIRATVAAVLAADPEPRGVAEALADVDRAARAMWAAEHGVSLDGWALVMATTREHWRLLAAAALDAKERTA